MNAQPIGWISARELAQLELRGYATIGAKPLEGDVPVYLSEPATAGVPGDHGGKPLHDSAWLHACPKSTGEVLLPVWRACRNCGATVDGVAPARQYLYPTRVDALITVLEGECDGLAVTRETAEAILHYLENAPAGVLAFPSVTEATAMWDRFVVHHARRIGVEPAKLENLIGGAEGLKRDFLDAQEKHVTRGVTAVQGPICENCKGSGMVHISIMGDGQDEPCKTCHGTGRLPAGVMASDGSQR